MPVAQTAVKDRIRTACKQVNVPVKAQNMRGQTRTAGWQWTIACLCVSI